jgi:membrane protease YdiL (CAAX protease family)
MQPMGLGESLLYFGIPTLLMYLATHIGIPLLERSFGQYLFGQPLLICWFISGGAVFMLLFVAALVCYRRDGHPWQASALIDRFGLTRPTLPVLGWTLLGMVAIGGLSYGILKLGEQFVPGYTPQPPFMKIRPLAPSETWLLLFWLPLFFFNILGEGFFWRGYIFPRQRLAFGSLTWLVHAGCWTLFHLPFGLGMISAALPILVIVPYLVQKTKSTWPDLLVHGVLNGSAFILIALGVISG